MLCPNCAYHDTDTKTCARCGAAMIADKAASALPTPEQQAASGQVAAAPELAAPEAPVPN